MKKNAHIWNGIIFLDRPEGNHIGCRTDRIAWIIVPYVLQMPAWSLDTCARVPAAGALRPTPSDFASCFTPPTPTLSSVVHRSTMIKQLPLASF